MKQCLIIITMIFSCGLTPVMARGFFVKTLGWINPMMFDDKERVADEVSVEILHDDKSPVRITDANVKDKGTSLLKMKGLEQAFTTKAYNNGGNKVMAYQLVWERHLPFEEYAEQDIRVNNINSVQPGDSDVLEFRKPIYYRKDTFYKVFVAKVLLENGTIWKSERDFDVGGYWADIKKEIDKI